MPLPGIGDEATWGYADHTHPNSPMNDHDYDDDPNEPFFDASDCSCGCPASCFKPKHFRDYQWHCPDCGDAQESEDF